MVLRNEDWSWRDKAACKGMGTGPWFGPPLTDEGKRQPRLEREAERAAKSVCNGVFLLGTGLVRSPCPVRRECLNFALRHLDGSGGEESGVWGGFTARKRRPLRRGDQVKLEDPVRRKPDVVGAEEVAQCQGPANVDGPQADERGGDAVRRRDGRPPLSIYPTP